MTTKRLQKVLSLFRSSPYEQASGATGDKEVKKSGIQIVNVDKSMELPSFDELPSFKNFKGCAWDVWGPGDNLGTVNLLTPDVVRRAAAEEIMCDKSSSSLSY